jgi:hypothetical protein
MVLLRWQKPVMTSAEAYMWLAMSLFGDGTIFYNHMYLFTLTAVLTTVTQMVTYYC